MSKVEGDPKEAVRFLRWLRPAGPWVLTAIPPEGGRTFTETFSASQSAEMERWISERDGRQNLYFMVNPATGNLSKKAMKEDVASVEFLHVDVDPPKGLPADQLDEERARIRQRIEAFGPAPTAIIDSGGGCQGFWRLDEAIHVGGDRVRAADAEAYNQQIELVLGGDSCHNVDRIMRLPGTVNIPGEKKRKAGRTERVARVLFAADPGQRVYNLAEFTPAPKVQVAGANGSAPSVQIDGNLPSILLDDLPPTVTPRTKMLIAIGEDPDDPTRYGSRSDVVWAVVCEMVRAKCDDNTIAAILLDKDYAISGHVLAQKRSREYAARQIQRAKEQVEEPLLRELNEKHAVIADLGGKCRVISEVLDDSLKRPRTRISKQSFDDFRNRYMHIRVQVGQAKDGNPIYKPAGKWWLEHSMRRQFTSLVFSPAREVEDAYNLWRGFACEAIPGNGHQLYLDHLRDNICSGNEEHYQYLVQWMARAVQHPDEAGQVCIVLRGGQGTGKGTAISEFGFLWGRHFLHVSSAKHLVGQFNAHLRDCVVLFADEAFFAGDKQHESVLKTLVTEETLIVEGKGVDAETSPNYTHILMSSNSHWVVPAGPDERRYFVLDVGEDKKQDSNYFKAIRAALDRGGRANLLHYLMSMDLSDFEVRKVPQTEALREQKLLSLSVEEQWWMERLMDGRTTRSSDGWETSVTKERIQRDYLQYAEDQRVMRRVSPTALGKFLSRVMPGNFPIGVQKMTDVMKTDEHGHTYQTRERAYWYDLPPLEACRERWDERYGGPFQWPEDKGYEEPKSRPRPNNNDPY